MRFLSWNVNGIRAAQKKGLSEWILQQNADVICLQETKAREEQVPMPLRYPKGYSAYFASSERGGYSGIAMYFRHQPLMLERGVGIKKFDVEGRVIRADYPMFTLFNVYFPNGGASTERLNFKLEFYDRFLAHIESLRKTGKSIIVCGDVNTAHKEIDIARPKENVNNSGFMPIERAWLDKLIEHGYVDTFRMFNHDGGQYTWWDMKTAARERNVGWRLDYFFASEDLKDRIRSAYIMPEVLGSDHCPVGLDVDVN